MWTNNSIIPVQAKINAGTAPLLITESNGSYILFRHDFGNSGISTIGFLPIQFEYGIHNKYLTNIKTEGLHVPSYLHISIRPTDFTFPVHDLSGAVIFMFRKILQAKSLQIIPHYYISAFNNGYHLHYSFV